MNESKAENLFLKDVRAAGGVAVKLRHRFMAGLPDAFVKMPGWTGTFLEFKYQPWPKKRKTLRLELTPLQRHFLHKMQAVRQPCGWVLFTDCPDASHKGLVIFVGTDHEQTEVDPTKQPWWYKDAWVMQALRLTTRQES